MRQNKFVATKDHFIMLAASNETGDALWSGHVEFRRQDGSFGVRTLNAIAFLVRGSVNTFINSSDTGEDWRYYSEASSPVALIREDFTDFGVVSTSNSVLFGSIISKENLFTGQTEYILGENVNELEKSTIESSDQTVAIQKQCKVYAKRDLNTFAGVEQEPLNIHVIPDSEIQVEIEEP